MSLAGGKLEENLKAIPGISDIVTEEHIRAIDDRLLIIFATVEYCRKRNKINIF